MQGNRLIALTLILGLAVAMLISGCSNESISGSNNLSSESENGQDGIYLVGSGQLRINAQVMTVDENQRMLTFEGVPEEVIALQNCEIVRYSNETDSPIPFADITPGEMGMVWANMEQNGYIYAYRIKLYGDDCPLYDVAFRDTIATIDYAAGTFTVNNRTETIQIDENTVIVTIAGGAKNTNYHDLTQTTNSPQIGTSAKVLGYQDIPLEFTDLQVGYEVEVRANIIDENNLLAAVIKVAHSNYQLCTKFDAYLASVDVENRVVTFDGLAWNGLVCQNAVLLDVDGTALLLEDFAAGEYVSVKGFALEGDDLKICVMAKIEAEG